MKRFLRSCDSSIYKKMDAAYNNSKNCNLNISLKSEDNTSKIHALSYTNVHEYDKGIIEKHDFTGVDYVLDSLESIKFMIEDLKRQFA